ncbi:hypothetical protein F53441_3855 [Fusarium austroafricanum]|uniref:Uncharacterized protein n=1 Tax=Fusarium austroafricanum TaxID=2364996 RepID=A0A8H4P1C4_9HYPO|nr:hypothetical protein F53441_3855 [Fusarium austroafricanum]
MVASEPLSPIPAHAFHPSAPGPVTLLLAPSSHTVQPSILDLARVRDLHASPCYSKQDKDKDNRSMGPRDFMLPTMSRPAALGSGLWALGSGTAVRHYLLFYAKS